MNDEENVITNSQEQNSVTNEESESQGTTTQVNNINAAGGNTIKDPDEWKTGDEAMTGAQKSYLKTLSDEAGEDFDENLTKAEASKKIEFLQQKTGRGSK